MKNINEIKERIEELEKKIGYIVSEYVYYKDDDLYTIIDRMIDPEEFIYNNQISDYIKENFNTVNYVNCEEKKEVLEKYEEEINEKIDLINKLNELDEENK